MSTLNCKKAKSSHCPTRTARKCFIAFFSRSKITDAEGRLLSLYHGSNAYEEIHVFRRGKNGYLGGGIYLTDSESYARKYADKNGYKGRIYNVYANASSPLEVSTNTPAKEILTIAKSA